MVGAGAMADLTEVTEARKAAAAGAAAGADLEAAAAADMIAVLTEAAEGVREEEEAWGRCYHTEAQRCAASECLHPTGLTWSRVCRCK